MEVKWIYNTDRDECLGNEELAHPFKRAFKEIDFVGQYMGASVFGYWRYAPWWILLSSTSTPAPSSTWPGRHHWESDSG